MLDLTSVIVGPACTVRLADYGAEVIKIESREGDLMRTLGGPSPTGAHSGSFVHFNRGKRTICLDLKKADARDVIEILVAQADVFVSNIRPAALERLRLDPVALCERHPTLIHCTITGFGPDGPYRGLPAYDSVLQGASGLSGLFGRRDGTPIYVPLLICDHVVGEIAAGAVLAALFERSRTGLGSAVEVPMFETMAAFVLQEHLGPETFRPAIGPLGDSRILSAFNGPLPTSDGWLSLTTNTDAQTAAFLRLVGRPDLLDDPRFRTSSDRFRHADDWFAFRREALRGRPSAEWLEAFSKADIPAMPCHSLDTLLDDPHLAAVDLWQDRHHPTEGEVRSLRQTVLRNGKVSPAPEPAHPVGWDTREVLSEAGLSEARIDALVSSGAAFEAPRPRVEARA